MGAGTAPPQREGSGIPATVTRVTSAGRTLTYVLRVIQEPERARACGSGAKSSADRRPVDPPPVVELRIYEGENDRGPDITFAYEANFFLFATLEVARPVANGRLPHPVTPQVPVLTGMPVSGMAYLDRPTEAGYFIFPDLSVRHEGKYRLSFNLYEETKNKNEDGDAEPSNGNKKMPNGAGLPDSSFDWRLEVKSNMFTVFSAKKFPGLAESTVLSRTVAEQGCRVRIRRDVRMRRREEKSGRDYDEAPEDEYARGGRNPEQSPYVRGRSGSGSPESAERAQYQGPEQHRLSGEFHPQQYPHPQFTPSPVADYAPPPPGGHLGGYGRPTHGPTPTQFAPPPLPAPPTYQQPSPAYHAGPPGPPGPPTYRAPAAQESSYPPWDRQIQSAYPSNPPREREQQFEGYRRASAPYPTSSGPSQFPSVDSSYNRASYHSYAPRQGSPTPSVSLPPLKLASIETKYEHSPPGRLASVSHIAPPLTSPSYERAPERSSTYSQHAPTQLPSISEAARNGKRPFDAVFASTTSTESLYNHMRPSSPHQGMYDDEAEEAAAMEAMKMQYRRADGTNLSRELPALSTD